MMGPCWKKNRSKTAEIVSKCIILLTFGAVLGGLVASVFADGDRVPPGISAGAGVTPPMSKNQNGCTPERSKMPTIGSKTRTIRVYPDDLEKIERLVEEGMTFSGAVHHLINGSKNENTSDIGPVMEEIADMASCCSVTVADLVKTIFDLLEDGTLMISADGVRVQGAKWASDFEEACRDRGVPVEKAAESAIKALKRGGL